MVTTRQTVVIVGAGAAGTLTALHLVRTAGRRSTAWRWCWSTPPTGGGAGSRSGPPTRPPAQRPGVGHERAARGPRALRRRGTRQGRRSGLGALRPQRLPAATAVRALPRRHADPRARRRRRAGDGRAHVRDGATGVVRTATGVAVLARAGRDARRRRRRGGHRAPAGRPRLGAGVAADSAFFVPDPWAPGALDVVRRDQAGPRRRARRRHRAHDGRRRALAVPAPAAGRAGLLHAVSRTGGCRGRTWPSPKLAAIPDIADWGSTLDGIRERTERHLPRSAARPATGARPSTGSGSGVADAVGAGSTRTTGARSSRERRRRLERPAPPDGAVEQARCSTRCGAPGGCTVAAAEVADAEPLPRGGLAVTLTDGTRARGRLGGELHRAPR